MALIESVAAREFSATRGPGGKGWSLSTQLGRLLLSVRSCRKLVRIWVKLPMLGRLCETVGIHSLTVKL